MRKLLTPLLFSAFFISAPVMAQDYKTLLDLPAGQTLVTLSATESRKVSQDLLVATLQFESQDKSAKVVQDRINETMKKAIDKAKAYSSVKVSTEQYYVYPYDFDPNPRPMDGGTQQGGQERSWRGSQSMQIQGKDAESLLKLAGELQAMGLAMNGLNYTLSSELAEETQESLMEAAIEKLNQKAKRAAKALGKADASLLQVDLQSGGNYPQPVMMRGMAMAEMSMAKMDAPVAEPGESEISMSVSATALLK